MTQLDSFIFKIDDRLEGVGATLSLDGRLAQAQFELGDHEFVLDNGIAYNLVLTNTAEGILLTGIVKADATCPCDRCCEPAQLQLSCEVDEYYLFNKPEKQHLTDLDEEEDVDYSLVSAENTIDLAPAIVSALVMEVPYIVLCDDDCLGLCSRCGANLNEGSCECERGANAAGADAGNAAYDDNGDPIAQDERSKPIPEGPFSALGKLHFDE